MDAPGSIVTLHMAASLDGYIARKDGSVDWMDTQDVYEGGVGFDPAEAERFLATIGCYVMGARTYELACGFEAKGLGSAYGDKPVFVLSHREITHSRPTVEARCGDLAQVIRDLRLVHGSIWVVGGGAVAAESIRLGLIDEIRYTILPVIIGEGISFFGTTGRQDGLHLLETKAYKNGVVELRYAIRR